MCFVAVSDVLVGSLRGLLQLSVSHTDFSCILQGDKSAAQSEKEPSLFVSRYLGRDRRGDTNQWPDRNTTWPQHICAHTPQCALSHLAGQSGFLLRDARSTQKRSTQKTQRLWNGSHASKRRSKVQDVRRSDVNSDTSKIPLQKGYRFMNWPVIGKSCNAYI